jgi:hypothetical protein
LGNDHVSGVNGAICNVVYFNKNISNQEIANIYNLGILKKTYPG